MVVLHYRGKASTSGNTNVNANATNTLSSLSDVTLLCEYRKSLQPLAPSGIKISSLLILRADYGTGVFTMSEIIFLTS